jgi:serine/threonine protein kinase
MDFVCHFYFPSCDLSKPTPEPVQACREFCEDIDTSGECASLYQQVVTFAGQFGTLLVPDCSTLPSKTSLTSQCYTNISEFSAMTSSNEAPSDCYLASDNGLTYTGTVNVTASGLPCMSWDLQLPFDVRPINSLLRRDLIGHNYCRNPEQRSDQPWCYASTSSGIVPENCAVAACVAPSPQTALPTYAIIVIAVIGGIIVALVIAISFVICCICCQKKKTKGYPLMDASGEYRLKSLDRPVTAMDMNNDHYVATNGPGGGVLIPTQYEGIELPQFPRDDIVYIRDLGQGNFGLVVQAEARGITKEEESTTVAVKVLKEGAGLQAKQEFFKEASLMHEFVHPNILRLLGVCIEQEPLCMIFEYMELGDLNNFLRKNDPRKMSGSKQNLASGILPPSAVGTEQQVNMAVDISAGLEYLSSHHYVHRDMASRNCLVSGKLRVKIADFGLSQDVYSSDYYRLGESSLLPVRWMPPEAIIYGKFTLQSDIWSFGVVMWELFSYGQQPYFSMTNEEVCQYVRAGQVLPCPDSCPQEIYDLMLDCWAMEPSDRPTASELHTGLRRWNPDISASLSLQRNVAKQPDYQNFAVVKEYEKDGSSRSNTITASTSETVPILPNKRRSYTTSEGAPVSPTTNGGFMKNPGAVEDEV